MREYDDNDIRVYTPVLQRVIILLAVIIAVPVVMWTITTMVRTYVAPPKLPTFQHLTENQPTDTASDAASVPGAQQVPSPPSNPQMADVQAAPAQARTALLEIKKPPTPSQPAAAPQSAAAPTAAVAHSPSAAPAVAAVAPMPAAPSPASAQPAPSSASVAPVPLAAAPSGTASVMASAAPAAPASPSAMAWPNPNAGAPPDVGAPAGRAISPAPDAVATNDSAPAATQPQTSAEAAGDDLPAGKPIAGPVPLPRHRPMQFAMVQGATMPGAIPLPRPRPADAPAAAPATPTDQPEAGYAPDMEPGHY